MYHFPYFKENERQILLDFMEEYPFAFLTGSFLSGNQVATQIPVLVEEKDGELMVKGHLMRNTDHHKAFMENSNALLVFTGPNSYVSASWYSNPQIGSTWNYMSIHITGQIRFLSEVELIGLMKKFTLKFENGNSGSATIFENLPDSYTQKMIQGIVGFEIRADNIENVFKLSQNRDEESYQNIISKLKEQGSGGIAIASEMEKRKALLFPEDEIWDGAKFD